MSSGNSPYTSISSTEQQTEWQDKINLRKDAAVLTRKSSMLSAANFAAISAAMTSLAATYADLPFDFKNDLYNASQSSGVLGIATWIMLLKANRDLESKKTGLIESGESKDEITAQLKDFTFRGTTRWPRILSTNALFFSSMVACAFFGLESLKEKETDPAIIAAVAGVLSITVMAVESNNARSRTQFHSPENSTGKMR